MPCLLGEARQRGLRIVGDGVDAHARRRQLLGMLLQLDQLRHAVGSPDRGALEHDGGLASGPVGVEVDRLAALVGQDEVGQPLADGGTGGEIGASGNALGGMALCGDRRRRRDQEDERE